jgi:hypothetical protein
MFLEWTGMLASLIMASALDLRARGVTAACHLGLRAFFFRSLEPLFLIFQLALALLSPRVNLRQVFNVISQ